MSVKHIELEIAPLRNRLNNHRLYQHLNSIEDVRVFMKSHVFAVWDFMSLLKALQSTLTTLSVPWTPSNDPALTRFVNEIVFAEESDLNEIGEPKSHFEMYLDAMRQIGANTEEIDTFIRLIREEMDINKALKTCIRDKETVDFLKYTFRVIASKKPHMVASAFTFGREDVIPDMFIEILKSTDPENKKFKKLKFYLERHIELDGDEHGPLSLQMMEKLCGDDADKWSDALSVAKESLEHRLCLWDMIASRIENGVSNKN